MKVRLVFRVVTRFCGTSANLHLIMSDRVLMMVLSGRATEGLALEIGRTDVSVLTA